LCALLLIWVLLRLGNRLDQLAALKIYAALDLCQGKPVIKFHHHLEDCEKSIRETWFFFFFWPPPPPPSRNG